MDPLVRITKVSDVQALDPATLAPNPQRQITFMVGDHGPFQIITPAKQWTQEYVNTEVQKVVDNLRAIGAITS